VHHASHVPQLTDGVIRLDAHTEADIPAHLAGEDEETARRFGWWPRQSTDLTVRRAYEEWSDDWTLGRSRRTFAVRLAMERRLVGGCELRLQPGERSGHVSYWTHQADRGNGYAQRALRLLVTYAGGLGLEALEGHVAADNVASRAVLQGCGFAEKDRYDDEEGALMVRYGLQLRRGGVG
jgi:RimJ/RimL family protein N-acetyltransferase